MSIRIIQGFANLAWYSDKISRYKMKLKPILVLSFILYTNLSLVANAKNCYSYFSKFVEIRCRNSK